MRRVMVGVDSLSSSICSANISVSYRTKISLFFLKLNSAGLRPVAGHNDDSGGKTHLTIRKESMRGLFYFLRNLIGLLLRKAGQFLPQRCLGCRPQFAKLLRRKRRLN